MFRFVKKTYTLSFGFGQKRQKARKGARGKIGIAKPEKSRIKQISPKGEKTRPVDTRGNHNAMFGTRDKIGSQHPLDLLGTWSRTDLLHPIAVHKRPGMGRTE